MSQALRIAAILSLAWAGAANAQERHALRDERVAVYNLVGEMRVEAGSGREVVVEVTRGGNDARELRVERGRVGDAETVRVIYPEGRIVYPAMGRGSQTQLTVRRDGTFGGGWSVGGDRVTIAGSGRGTEGWADVRVRVPAGQTVAVHQAVGRVFVSNVQGTLRVHGASASVRAEGTRGDLGVDVGSGSVEVTGANGNLNVDTGSGGVRLNGVRGSRLIVDTGSGGVTATDVAVEDVRVNVGSGAVRLDGVRARDLVVDTGSGSVSLALAADARNVKIDTGSGGVTMSVPDGYGAEVEIDTGSGGIDVDVPMTARTLRRSRLTGRIGDGDGRLTIDTGSGGVRIRRR
jgi:hypothetical protein